MNQPTGGDRRPPGRARPRPRTRTTPGKPLPGREPVPELTDDDQEWARRIVATLPPLTDRQRDILALLLRRRR
jgi:hypothetical protein